MHRHKLIHSIQTILLAFLVTSTAYLAAPLLQESLQAAGERSQDLFAQKCKACHTIGGGRTVGPDLKGVTSQRDRDWLIKFIATPDRLIAQGDPIAKQLVQQYGIPMPNMGLTEEDAREVLAYIEAHSAGSPAAPPPPQIPASASPGQAANANLGRDLFTGNVPLKNGGPPCFSCHNISGLAALGGGNLAADLTNIYAVMNDQGLWAVLKTTPFPLMKDVYGSRPLTDDEIANLTAFFKDTSQQTATSRPFLIFIGIGAVGALLAIGLFHLFWRSRLPAVRRPLVNASRPERDTVVANQQLGNGTTNEHK